MIPDNEYETLNTPEACRRFREQYQDTAFRSAYALTGSYTQAETLTQVFFEQMQREYRDRPLPDALELYILSRMNYLYAKGVELVQPAPASPFREAEQPQTVHQEAVSPETAPKEGVLLGQVYYVPSQELAGTVRAASPELLQFVSRQAAEQAPPVPEQKQTTMQEPVQAPEQAPREPDAHTVQAVFDPEVTAMWTPAMEGENPVQVSAVLPPKPKKAPVSDATPRSIPLTVTNTILMLAAIGAVVFLISSLHLF